MKKLKKLALVAASMALAGTMAVSFVACGPSGPSGPSRPGPGGGGNNGTVADRYGVLNADGTINYDTYKNRNNGTPVSLNVAIGYSSLGTSTSFLDLTQTVTLPDGVTYNSKAVKPAWVQMGKDLNVTWNDVYDGVSTSNNIVTLVNAGKYNTTDIFTTDLSVAVTRKTVNHQNILNLADYLDYMPNFHKFLNDNPVVYLSLLQYGMNINTGAGQEILVAPYFDGNDDIERYCIVRHDWAEKLLNGSVAGASKTFASACNAVEADSFMGNADYTVDALTADGKGTQKIKKNYTNALAAVKGNGAFAAAYNAIDAAGYKGNSGNIVDIMNAALEANANATGAQLLNLFRAYIEVAFTNESDVPVFSAANRANIFIGYDACWDVDDLVAMLRCVKTNESVVACTDYGYPGKVGGIAPRDGKPDRLAALVSLACQLYGVRGGTSRNEFTYIDNKGVLQDARSDLKFYEAMTKMNDLYKEGLIADYTDGGSFITESGVGTGKNVNDKVEYFMVYDYSQTQTTYGFYSEDGSLTGADTPDDYYFAPVITPVSKWDVDADGSIAADEYFRFTESWRSTKTSGLAVNGAVANNPAKLEAVLEFIDYLYSEDGQIVSTFGPMAKADGSGGFWYNEAASADEIAKGEYFTYKGTKYHGTEYKDRYTPTVTKDLILSFKGKSTTHSNNWKINGDLIAAQLSFTDYARMLLGSTLPMGVKDQSFENQLTSQMGKAGADTVGKALKAGVIKGMSLEIKADNYWFTCVPTTLPVEDGQAGTNGLASSNHLLFQHMTGTASGNGDFLSVMTWIILNGTSGKYEQQDVNITFTSIEDMMTKALGTSTVGALANSRREIYNGAWSVAKLYWNYLNSSANK